MLSTKNSKKALDKLVSHIKTLQFNRGLGSAVL